MKINFKMTISDILFAVTMVLQLSFPDPHWLKAIPIMAFFAYMMVLKVLRYKEIKNTFHIVGAFLFLGYAYLSRQWALYPAAISEQFNNVLWSVLLSTALSTYVIHRNLSVRDVAERLLPIALLFVVNVVFNGRFANNRLSVGGNENAFGRISSGLACFAICWSKQERWRNFLSNGLALALILITCLSGSRTALLLLALYAIAILLFEHPLKKENRFLKRLLTVLFLCGVAYICVMNIGVLYNAIGHRIESLWWIFDGTGAVDGSAITRINMMELARELFLRNPWLGVGMNNFKFVTRYDTYAHSNYYELAACLGIVGLILYYSPLTAYLRKAIRKWKKDENAAIVPMIILGAFLLGDIGSVSYFNISAHIFVGLAIGLVSNGRNVKSGDLT